MAKGSCVMCGHSGDGFTRPKGQGKFTCPSCGYMASATFHAIGESVCGFVRGRRLCRAPLWYPMLGEWTGEPDKCDDLRKVIDGGYCERVSHSSLRGGGA